MTFTYPYSTAPDGTQLTTEQVSSGQMFFVSALPAPGMGSGFKYARTDGYTEYFNTAGQLVAVQNPAGLQQTYEYNIGGQLTSVTDSFDRQLTFTYYGSGFVQTVTTPTGALSYAYDASGNLQTVTYPDGGTITYEFNDTALPHAMTGIKDEDGNEYAAWSYDDTNGQATCSENAPSGNAPSTATTCKNDTSGVDKFTVAYTTNGAGIVTGAVMTEPSTTGNSPLVRNLNFTNINFMTLLTGSSAPCTECGDKSRLITYDSNGYVSSRTDFANAVNQYSPDGFGNVTTYVHDAFGNETSRTEGYGTQDARTITTQWDYSVNQPLLITEPGRTTGYTYDSVGHALTKTVTDTATSTARTTTYTYYSSGVAAGLLETVTDPLNHVTSYAYDAQGNLSTITNALNQVTHITQYDPNGMPLTIIDPNNVETDLTYDGRQRLKTRTVAGALTTFDYDLVGNLTQVTLPAPVGSSTGASLTYTYDAAHRLTGIQDSVGDSITYTLDNLGNRHLEQTKDPNGTLQKTLQRNYNDLNQLITTIGGAGQTTQYTVDHMGNTTSVQDPMTNVTGQTFDALNRLATVVDPESGNTTYVYDPLDRVQHVTDPKGLDTQYTYDAFGDVTRQLSPDTGTTTYTYDLDGNRLSKTDARGITALYIYDALNRLTGITYPDASRDVAYTYDQGTDGIGHLTGIQDVTGTTAYQYDSHGNTTQKAVTLGSHTFTIGYQYDTADNLTGMTYPDGMQVNYGRDTAERVTSISKTQGGNTQPVVSGITYEPFGPITQLIYGNDLIETRSYDQDYRLTGISVPGVLDWTLTPNADDDITNITDNINSANSQTLGYDTLNRLTSASGAYGSQSYAYDITNSLDGYDGNRTSEILNGVPTTLTYDTTSNKLLTVGTQSYQYDAVGNLTSDGTHSYDYDASNRLTGYDSTPTAYFYNGLGQRAVKFPMDSDLPTISITNPAPGAVSGTVNVTASVADDFGITSVQFQLDGADLGGPVTAAPYTVSWDTATATAGTHVLTAIATDPANNTATSAPVNVTVSDTTPPVVAITSPAAGSVSGTINVVASASDNVGVASVQFKLDGANLGSSITASPYTVSWDTTTASAGAHTLTAVAIDAAGNVTTSLVVSVTVDNIWPTVAITAPTNNASVSGVITMTASASDNIGVTSVQFVLDHANDLGAPVTAAPYTISWDSATVSPGTHTLTAHATDAAGHTTISASVSFTVQDNTPPVVSITSPVSGPLWGTVNLTASASDDDSVQSVQFMLDGASLGFGSVHGTGNYAFLWNPTGVTGTHTLTAVAKDPTGNTTTSMPVSITVYSTSPTISITSPANNATVTGTVNVSASVSNGNGVASVQFERNFGDLGAAVTAAPYMIAWDTSNVAPGSYSLKAVASDVAGHTVTSAGVNVKILDITPPTVSITSPIDGASVSNAISVTATASDNGGVTSVQFKLDGANLGSADTTSPYAVSWNAVTATLGAHTLTAVANDAAGNTTTSAPVSVTVIQGPTAPTLTPTGTTTITAGSNVTLNWAYTSIPGSYFVLQSSLAPGFGSPNQVYSGTNTTITKGPYSITVYFRVQACNSVDNCSPWSTTSEFFVNQGGGGGN